MSDKLPATRTLMPRVSPVVISSILSGLLALGAVALVALGVALIYFPAGVITAGLGCALLQWQFFAGQG